MSWLRRRKTPLNSRAARGVRAEDAACHYLQAHGYSILERNARFPVGEIDVVAQDGRALCFVEVRSTSSQQWGGALASITDRKRRRLVKAAQWYLRFRTLPVDDMRFDVVAVDWREGTALAIDLVRGAFTADGLLGPGG